MAAAEAVHYHARREATMVRWRISSALLAGALVLAHAGCSRVAETDGHSVAEADVEVRDDDAAGAPSRRQQVMLLRWWENPATVARLGLTEEQVQRIEQSIPVPEDQAMERTNRERRATTRFLRALNQDPYDPVLVDRMSEELDEVLASGHRIRIEQVRALRDILTHEQWTALWDIAPQAFQVGRVRVLMGPRIRVDGGAPGTTTDNPGDVPEGPTVGE